MLSPKVVDDCLNKLGMLRFFPTSERVIAEVGRLLVETCKNDSEAIKLTASVVRNSSEWPGAAGLVAAYRSEFSKVKYFDPSNILPKNATR
jgi:hypothetical protein